VTAQASAAKSEQEAAPGLFKKKEKSKLKRSFYFEIWGPSEFYSVGLEYRFFIKRDKKSHTAFRFGLGYLPKSFKSTPEFIVPLQITQSIYFTNRSEIFFGMAESTRLTDPTSANRLTALHFTPIIGYGWHLTTWLGFRISFAPLLGSYLNSKYDTKFESGFTPRAGVTLNFGLR
jgi:hypothetical protein